MGDEQKTGAWRTPPTVLVVVTTVHLLGIGGFLLAATLATAEPGAAGGPGAVGVVCFGPAIIGFGWALFRSVFRRGQTATAAVAGVYVVAATMTAVGAVLTTYEGLTGGVLPTRTWLVQAGVMLLVSIYAGACAALSYRWLAALQPREGYCTRCGYDLRGTAAGASCPECGAVEISRQGQGGS